MAGSWDGLATSVNSINMDCIKYQRKVLNLPWGKTLLYTSDFYPHMKVFWRGFPSVINNKYVTIGQGIFVLSKVWSECFRYVLNPLELHVTWYFPSFICKGKVLRISRFLLHREKGQRKRTKSAAFEVEEVEMAVKDCILFSAMFALCFLRAKTYKNV